MNLNQFPLNSLDKNFLQFGLLLLHHEVANIYRTCVAVDLLVNNAGITTICMLEDAKDIDNLKPVIVNYIDHNSSFGSKLLLKYVEC